ncbi:hypothetical protein SFRURICE_017749 [Spodoptera frugiperda]|nr:hypothetical protein SFRURICE_017749 [Spodoptera frugiperda]
MRLKVYSEGALGKWLVEPYCLEIISFVDRLYKCLALSNLYSLLMLRVVGRPVPGCTPSPRLRTLLMMKSLCDS